MRSLLALVLVAPLPALADPPETTVDPARSPGFVQIDRYDATSVAGGDLTYVSLADDGVAEDVTVLRFQLGGRYLDQASRFGGYANLPITYASGNDESLTGIGNLEVGGLMLPRLGDGSTAVVLRAGLTLPTGSDGEETFANLFGVFGRPQDLYLALPKATSVRLGVSPMFRRGNLFGRIDIGFDLNLDIQDAEDTADPLLRLNAGIGVDLGTAAIMGELSNLYVFSDDDADDSLGDKMLNVFALSTRFVAGNAMPYVSLLIPLDDDSTDAIDLALTLGVEARL